MRQSALYTKTRRETPRDEVSKNARLLVRGGFVNKEMAGVYSYLPLGVMVLRKIENIIREEMNSIGGQEVYLSVLQNPHPWKMSGRWNDSTMSDWFKTRNSEFGLGNTHEEPLAYSMRYHISSYKDLPIYVYQIQSKFRKELRAKSGLLRGREFIMKDLYSFNKDTAGLDTFYEKCARSYKKIFKRVGIGDKTYFTFASGGVFSKYSHEFQTINDAGEDTIYIDEEKGIAINKEVYTKKTVRELGLNEEKLIKKSAIEVGNIFKLGTRFSEALGLTYADKNGNDIPVVMGSYGIGLGRLMATLVEVLSDNKGIVWPESVSPFKLHLIELGSGLGKNLYNTLKKNNIDVLYDDRDITAGEKFTDADLLGIPWRFVVSPKTGKKIEIKKRTSKKAQIISYDEAIRKFS